MRANWRGLRGRAGQSCRAVCLSSQLQIPNKIPTKNQKGPQTWEVAGFHVTCWFLFTGMHLQKLRPCPAQDSGSYTARPFQHLATLATATHCSLPSPRAPRMWPRAQDILVSDLRDLISLSLVASHLLKNGLVLSFMSHPCPKYILGVTR